MGPYRRISPVTFPAAIAQVPDQFFTRLQLRTRRLVAVKIAYETNAERDVVEIITVDMPAVDLPKPAIANLDLAIAGRSSIPDYEMIGQPIFHPAYVPMIIIKRARIPLPGAAVMHDDKFPARPLHRRPADRLNRCTR